MKTERKPHVANSAEGIFGYLTSWHRASWQEVTLEQEITRKENREMRRDRIAV